MTDEATVSGVLFPLGRVVATRGALEYLERMSVAPGVLLAKHQAGDWGDIDAEDRAENWLSVAQGFRIMSCYRYGPVREAIWVITEADRSSTTILLPADY